MSDLGRGTVADSPDRHLVFRLGHDTYAMDAADVREVIRPPALTRVPHGPAALAGIANLRGIALPVVSVAALLGRRADSLDRSGKPDVQATRGQKVVVYDPDPAVSGELVGLIVDEVVTFGASTETRAEGFDPRTSLASVFTAKRGAEKRAGGRAAVFDASDAGEAEVATTFLSFAIAGQMFALPIGVVHEVLRLPPECAGLTGADSVMRGILAYRETVLPLVSLAALLGLAEATDRREGARIIVADHQGATIGLIVDRIDAIRRVADGLIDALPPVLRRGGGAADVTAIARLDGGRTLVSVLSAERLFGHDVIEEAVGLKEDVKAMAHARGSEALTDAGPRGAERFLIFALGSETYGLPVEAVEEVVRVPDTVTRVPHAPAFVRGMMNLRGRAVPLIDQRLRFEAPAESRSVKPRAIILTIGDLRAGFVVDSTAEIVAIPRKALSDAFSFASSETQVFDRVAHIEADGRMILLVDPAELLSRAERDMVALLAAEPAGPAT
jgi:purine-binding chemotaxis protein CheW